MEKTNIMNDINEVLDTYCEGCFLKTQLARDNGKTIAHNFCIRTCTVGEQLKFLGNEMNKMTK
ncbi:zinc-finger domain-containing protein [Filibacter tadaridae]|uniref:Zinc-finger domain-containing protein n=1 Tax=Filibacter tadaridae TaxID=2483811 RepID=A0A3P5X144_9BACL|nr:zinc-finger domain-containing protein [Filibacter tadaridae]VDC29085.1 hypothetical protein FILTAD_01977 [Filibacter tadaridae]